MKIVAIANQKGGVGKTTTVINLAACLGEMGQKVLVIDLDPQANATSGLGVEVTSGASMYQALLGNVSVTDLIKETPVPGVDIIPSELDLAGAEVDIARMDTYLHCLSHALLPVTNAEFPQYNFILLDCPPSLGILTMNSLSASHSIIVPMQCEYYALEGLSVIVNLINQLRDTGTNPGLGLEGIIMTMTDRRTNLSSQVVQEVRSHFADFVYKATIPRNVRLSEAPSHGMPVIMYDPSSTGAAAYREFAKEFLSSNT
jgi:chromosome partitioning protein